MGGGTADLPVDRRSLQRRVKKALAEDVGPGDLTTSALFGEGAAAASSGKAVIRAKAKGVLAGGFVAEEVFRQVDARYEALVNDGSPVSPGDAVARIKGPLPALLVGERVALNFLSLLSGVASLTRRFVEAVEGHPVKILDTRKTLPLVRDLEKYAVRAGGGANHRIGLYDQVLVKENHIAAAKATGEAGSFRSAVQHVLDRVSDGIVVGIEVRDLSEFHIAMEFRPAYVLCDNFEDQDVELAVRIRDGWPGEGRPEIEVSGNMTLERVGRIAAFGVDRISVGALTHSAPALDISMKIEP